MTIAVVVVAPSAVVETAKAWARLGLVADSLWVKADDLTGIDLDRPNAVPATYLRFEAEPWSGTLALQLAELGSLEEARVTWLRHPGSTNEALLRALDELARELLPYDRVHWLDIVAPERRTDETAVPLAGTWTQFRIHPSDRPAPDVSDAGWDLGRPVPLHVTLALTGILGGTTTALPWAQLSAAQNWVVRVFSRLIDGGLEARRQSQQFVLSVLPSTTAAEQHPADYLPATVAESAQGVESALSWLRTTYPDTLDYVPPEAAGFASHPRLSVGRHLHNFGRFLPIAFQAIFGLRADSLPFAGNVFESEDLGYNVGRPAAEISYTNGIPDFAAMESVAMTKAHDELARLRSGDGSPPSDEVWEPLAQLATALVDGGSSLPQGWSPPVRLKQRLSLPPELVSLSAAASVVSTTPEIALADNLMVAAETLDVVRRRSGSALRGGAETTVVTATVARLVRQGNERDQEELRAQLAAINAPAAPRPGPRSLLERLRGAVLGGLLRARLDSERWSAAAVRSPDGPVPDWDRPSWRYRRIWWLVVGVCVLAGVLWAIFNDDINDNLGSSIEQRAGLAAISLISVLILLLVLYLFYRAWNTFLERGRRRLELMSLWLDRAAQAWNAYAELLNTERATRVWADVLSAFLREDDRNQGTTTDIEIDQMPFSLRVGHPRFRPEQLREWLAEIGAQPGWRLACLRRLVADFLDCPDNQALQEIAKDPALPGGKLDRLSARLPELMSEWREVSINEIWNRLRGDIAEHSDRLEVPRSQGMTAQATRLRQFLAELTPDDGEQPWAHEHLISSTTGVPEQGAFILAVTPALTTASLRIQVQSEVHSAGSDGDCVDSDANNDHGPR